MLLKEKLFGDGNFLFEDGFYKQEDSGHHDRFQELYTHIRNREGRVYSNHEVKKLPDIVNNVNKKEWSIRKKLDNIFEQIETHK